MGRIAHLSDLHFGRVRPGLLEALLDSINAAAPDLVVVSGDLTQRARDWQFREARGFLDRLAAPWLAVPGNHDVPLDNVALRLVDPWMRYRRWIAADLEPRFEARDFVVFGLNTVNPLSWQRGRVGRRAAARFGRERLGAAPAGRIRVVVAHHPFELGPEARKAPMRGAARGMQALAAAGADVVLTGHLHTWRAEPLAAAVPPGALQVQAGTGLSTRLRGEANDFNLLTLRPGEVVVERFVAQGGGGFVAGARRRFCKGERGWRRS